MKGKIIVDGEKLYVEFAGGDIWIIKPVYTKVLFWKLDLDVKYAGHGKTLKEAIADYKSGRMLKMENEEKMQKKKFEKDLKVLEKISKGEK